MNLLGTDRCLGGTAQVVQRDAKRRIHEGNLQDDRDYDGQPHHVHPEFALHRRDQTNDDERDLEEVKEETHQENSQRNGKKKRSFPLWQVFEDAIDPYLPVKSPKDEGEKRSANQHKDHTEAQNSYFCQGLAETAARKPLT